MCFAAATTYERWGPFTFHLLVVKCGENRKKVVLLKKQKFVEKSLHLTGEKRS